MASARRTTGLITDVIDDIESLTGFVEPYSTQ